MGSLWPSNERKSMNLQILLVVLMEMQVSMQMGAAFRKVTDFNECVTVYGTDAFQEETLKGPSTKFQFHLNAEEAIVDLVDGVLSFPQVEGTPKLLDDEFIQTALNIPVKRLFFELHVACKEARKWGCAENYIVQK